MKHQLPTLGLYGIQDINDSGIPTLSHDHGLTYMHNGKILKHLQLERWEQYKHSNRLPTHLMTLLKQEGLLQGEFDLVFTDNILGRSFINNQGNLRFEAPLKAKLANDLEEGRAWWLNEPRKAYILNHELAHLGSCLPFYGAFIENSLLIHFDGGASLSNFSAWQYKNNELMLLHADWQMKELSGIFNANALMFGILGAKQADLNSVPGKLMGFAAFGQARPELEDWLIEHNFFADLWKSKKLFFEKAAEKFQVKLKHLNPKDPFIQDIVATAHAYFVRKSLQRFQELQEQTQTDYLYYSGGTALSIVLNTQLVNKQIFKQIYIPPCCSDSGLALGAAAFMEWKKHGQVQLHSPYLNNWGIENYRSQYQQSDIQQIAALLQQGKVIGICNGAGEAGPRALGNRSILALASSKKLAQKVSMDLKKREWYRPLAPVMLRQNIFYFTGKQQPDLLARHMLLDFDILPERQQELAGGMHVDHTARIQMIDEKSDNRFILDLLTYLDQKYQIKALLNTSFNIAGKPIVHNAKDALESARIMELDGLVINGKLQDFK